MSRLILFVFMLMASGLYADHIARLELKEIEWNGKVHSFNPVRKFEVTFREWSQNIQVDTIDGEVLTIAFKYEPVYNDTGERPAFHMVLFDSFNREFDVYTATDWVKGTYEAGMKVRDETGMRRWEGKLRYVPDTTVHLQRPTWRQDNFTLKIGTFRAWNSEAESKGVSSNKILKNLYFQGLTGQKTDMQSGGKFGDENYYLMIDPVRYQWAGDTWMEINVRLFRKQTDGKYVEILAKPFSSKDKNVFFNGVTHLNAYEVRDAKNKYYMLITEVLIIPY